MAAKNSQSVFVALMRGINVGGKNKLPMKELVSIFEEAGCDDVRTWIQSGNVIFCATPALAKKVPAMVTDAIATRLGIEIPVVTRTADQLRAVASNHPLAPRNVDPKTLHVAFLARRPSAPEVAALDPNRSPPDTFEVVGSEIYLRCPNGVARTKLTNAYFDRTLGTVSTVRNWKTVSKLVELAEG